MFVEQSETVRPVIALTLVVRFVLIEFRRNGGI